MIYSGTLIKVTAKTTGIKFQMNPAFYIAKRYLFSKKSTNAINIISLISMLGITVCTAAFIIILSVFNGFEGLVKEMYNSFYPDMKIESVEGKVFILNENQIEEIKAIEGIRAASQVLEENGLLLYGERQQPATLKGVDAEYIKITGMDTSMAFSDTFLLKQGGQYFAIIGSGIDQSLQVKLKDPLNRMTVFMPKRGKGRSILPGGDFKRDQIMVWDVFIIQDDFDSKYVFTPLEFTRNLLQYKNELSSIEIGLEPNADAGTVQNKLNDLLGSEFRVLTRYEQNAFLYRVMNIERLAVFVLLTFVLIIVAFNMIGSLSMIVIDKKKDIGILKTMGAGPSMIKWLFLTEGLLQAIISLIVGYLIALTLIISQQQFGLIPIQGTGSFIVQYYPVKMDLWDFIYVALIVMSIAVAASWFPASKAASQSPPESLKTK